MARALLEQWLKDPKTLADALGMDENQLNRMTPEELIEYFKQRLKDQDGRHDGGSNYEALVSESRTETPRVGCSKFGTHLVDAGQRNRNDSVRAVDAKAQPEFFTTLRFCNLLLVKQPCALGLQLIDRPPPCLLVGR